MTTRSLTFDDDLLAQAEAYAQRKGTDLSVLIADVLKQLVVAPARRQRRPISPEVAALAGSLPVPPDFDYKTALGDALRDKYL